MNNFDFDIKLWKGSRKVYRLNLEQRGLYFELILLAFKYDNSVKIKIDDWVNDFNTSKKDLRSCLNTLYKVKLIKVGSNILSIPSVERHLKKKAKVDANDYELIKTKFNEYCKSLPKIKTLSPTRKSKIRTRIKDNDLESLFTVFKMAEDSDFLSGRKTKWRANIDWLLNPTNFAKVLEGNYLNKGDVDSTKAQEGAPAGMEFFSIEYKGVKVVPTSWKDGVPHHDNLAIDILLKKEFNGK